MEVVIKNKPLNGLPSPKATQRTPLMDPQQTLCSLFLTIKSLFWKKNPTKIIEVTVCAVGSTRNGDHCPSPSSNWHKNGPLIFQPHRPQTDSQQTPKGSLKIRKHLTKVIEVTVCASWHVGSTENGGRHLAPTLPIDFIYTPQRATVRPLQTPRV